ncbi:Mucin-associated surface protein (MASP) [Trypanosoma cruzi]|uniref:Mucin-associated surface protein (MASP), putative n=2 Tax=Trypanosoma cruzi TaxID=5693 RepID=Q4DJ89_TRYCC|nr:mucin-associated surface protein (MASP), putative [Trypanosoma cruzi]EAN92591.1 mucin-associated surface protein (MASP), putative [Trypanosoma cruzi]PWV20413.1 Mucin-associated surface protein (MASP) [Trypanosoma cruzi]|eukprot:XP_814442.1 mucin-associated surface protein (MASP) [Trypanosoma cruzi strain CL Brener]
MAMMMTGRVLLVCALCVLWCGVSVVAADVAGGAGGSAVESLIAGRRAQLRRECAEAFGRRTGGGANISAVEECVHRGMGGVRAVVDGRSRWRRQHSAVVAAVDSDDKIGEGSDGTLKGLSSSDQMPQAGQGGEEGQEHTGSLEVTNKLEGNEDSQITGERNVSSDADRPKQTGSQVPAGGQPEDEEGTKSPQPPPPPPPAEPLPQLPRQPPPGTNTLQSEETHPAITAEKHSKPQDGGHSHETKMPQTKGSTKHGEGASSLQSPEIVSHLSRESTTPLSTSTGSSGVAGSTVENSGANNPTPPAASVTQHDSEGDTGPAAPPASNTELQSEEIPNAGIIATTYDDVNDSSRAAPTAERTTAGTRSTQTSGDAGDLERANNDDANDDVAHNGKTVEFEAASGNRDTEADNDEKYTTVPENATNNTINTEIPADSAGSTAVSHTTSPLLLLLVACAAAAAVVAA